MPLTRTGSPVELIKNDAYKEYYTESKDFLNQHKHLLKCTSCRSNLFNSVKLGKIHIHPLLLVLICEKCYNFYTSGDFSQDEDGYDKYCRWCGNGGLLYICSKCPYGFCKQCYKKNFPNMVAEMEDDDWECVVCQNKPLYKLQALVKVLLKLSATSSPVKPAPRSSKRRRKLSSSSEESIKKDKKIFKPSSSKGKKIDKKKKKSSSLNDSSNSHSEKEIDENQIPECSDEEFKKKSKEFLLMNIKNLKSTLDLGLKECSKLAPKIEESDLEKTKDIFKYSQHLDKLVVTLKGNLENVIVNYGMKSLKLKFIKRSLKNKQIKSESTKSQSKKKNLGSDASDDSNEDGDKKKTEKTEYKSIKDKEVKMFDDDDSDDMFPKNKSTPSINFDSLLEKIDSEDEFDNIKKKKSDDESNNKMLNGAEKKEKTKKNNSSDSENSEEEKKKKKRKRSISSEGGKKEKREKKDDDDSDKGGNNDETHDQSEDKAEAEDNIKDKDIDNDNKKDEGKKKEKDEEMEDIQEKSKLESEEKKSKNVDKNRKSQIKQDKEKDVKKGKESNDEDDDNDNDKEEENKIEKETEDKKEESKLESEEEKTIKHLNKSRKSQRKDDKKDKKFVKNNEDDENNDLIVDTNNEDGLEADDENDEVIESNKVDPDETVEMQELAERSLSAIDSDSEIESNQIKKSKRSVKKNEKSFNKGEKKIKKKEPLVNSSDSDTVFERLCNIKSLLKDKVKKIISDSDDEEEHNSSNNKNSKKQSSKTKRKILSSESETENEPIFEDEPMSELFKDDSDLTLDGLESLEEKMKQQMLDFIEDNFDDDLKEELNQDIKSNSVKSKKPSQKTTESNKKPSWRDHKLLRGKISDTDSDNEFEKWEKHKSRPSDTEQRKLRKRRKKQRVQLISSDEEENEVTILSTSSSEQDQFESTKKSSDSEDNKKKTKVLKRIKVAANSNSSSSDIEEISQDETAENSQKKRKNIRKVIKDTETALSTKQAAKEEEERQKRIEERQKLFYELMDKTEVEFNENLILDIDAETKEPLVRVHPKIAIKLKPHQVKGVQFMFNSVIESIKEIEKGGKGNGCILAHCMGLGKTLQVVSMIHALLTTPRCQIRTVMVVCPLSTVHNWIQEFRMWTKPCKDKEIEIFDLSRDKKHYERNYRLKDWQSTGGVLIIGYNMLRTLANPKQRIKKAIKDTYMSCLIDPGADIVICDEGHLLKNEKSALSQTMTQIKTLRRIILTGTPLQNNLIEYHCMVSFVKPNLLGTRKEFQNRFVNPITNGQFADSNTHDMRVMKRRAHVLHKMLESSVQRYDYSVLTPFLPPKFEFAVLIKLSERQIKMYQHYLDYFATKPGSGVKSSLFADFQALQRISTHPHVLRLRQDRYDRDQARRLTESEDSAGSLNEFIDDSSNSHSTESSDEDNSSDDVASIHSDEKKKKRVRKTRNYRKQNPDCSDEDKENIAEPKKEWWENYIDNEEIMDDINESGKLVILFEILKECESIGDKVLIFSQSLFSLNLIEYFLEKIDQQSLDKKLIRGCTSTWIKGADYFRLDGSTQCEVRHEHCKHFNNPKNLRARLFLISTKAGGLGINLTAANRVIIFDASWNPSYDMQSIFRVYRFGQIKPCFIYRFLSQGTMEEKVYDRQVTKLSLSCRVVDEQQIERHFNMSDLAELYRFEPTIHVTKSHGPPKDKLLADLMIEFPQWILDYHEHDSLLENKQEEELNEEERKEAWQDYENEKKGKQDNFTQNNILFQTLFNQCLTRFIQQYPSKTFEEVKQMAMSVAASQVQLHVEQFQQKQLQYQQQLLLQQQQLGNFPTSNQNLTQQEINQRHQMQIQFQNQMKYAKLYNNRNFQGSSSHSPHPNQFKAGQSTPQQSDKLDQQSE